MEAADEAQMEAANVVADDSQTEVTDDEVWALLEDSPALFDDEACAPPERPESARPRSRSPRRT